LEGIGEDAAAILQQDLLKPVPLGFEFGVHGHGFAGFESNPRIVRRNVFSFFHNGIVLRARCKTAYCWIDKRLAAKRLTAGDLQLSTSSLTIKCSLAWLLRAIPLNEFASHLGDTHRAT
jgi:hypothetical protein